MYHFSGDIPSVGSVTSEGSGSNIPAYESMALGTF